MSRGIELDAQEEIVALVRPAATFILWFALKTLTFLFFVSLISIPMLQAGIVLFVIYSALLFFAAKKLIELVLLWRGQMLIVTNKRVVDMYVSNFRLHGVDIFLNDIGEVKIKRHKKFPYSLLKLEKMKICGDAKVGFDIIVEGQNKASEVKSLLQELTVQNEAKE